MCWTMPRSWLYASSIRKLLSLIEEAYNQERGIVQHISTFSRATGSGDFVYTFTQEWPVKDAHHQLSFTLPVLGIDRGAGRDTAFGDVALNYRYQAAGVDGGAVAFAPRLSLLIPSGDSARGFGAGGVGVQVNLPISWEHSSRVVTHWNVGVTRSIRARNRDGQKASGTGYSLGQSFVFLAAPRVNLLVETLWTRTAEVTGPGITTGANALYVSPGIRWSHDFKNGLQIVPGLAFPIGIGPSRGDHAVFAYLSFEHPFRKSR